MHGDSSDIISFDLERSYSSHSDFLISCKGVELGHMLLLNINSKAYMVSPMTLLHLTLSDIERSNPRSLTFRSLIHVISYKGRELGHMLPLNINRKAYRESPVTSSHMTFSDLEMSNSRLLRFRSLLSRKGAELGHILLLNINRKAYTCMESPMTLLHLTLSDLESSQSRSLKL